MIKKVLGIAPQQEVDGSYSPSKLARMLAVDAKTDYSPQNFTGGAGKRIIILCTEEKHLITNSGKKFNTGNHPLELLVPVLHYLDAEFELTFTTPNGKPVALEMWAMPRKDDRVMRLYDTLKPQLASPVALDTLVASLTEGADNIAGIFIPGGHGALLGLPDNKSVGKLLHWALNKGKYIMAICHGPAALIAANEDGKSPFDGYNIAAFPDKMDKMTPKIGYLPGQLPWFFGEKLKSSGVHIVNDAADDTCHRYEKLITGASPKAANKFGIMCVESMLRLKPA